MRLRFQKWRFAPDRTERGNPTAQRWRCPHGVTVDFLIPPASLPIWAASSATWRRTSPRSSSLGVELAIQDSEVVSIDDNLPSGTKVIREIRVCGPGASIVLKALAFDRRGKPKKAYNLFYMLRHHRLGAAGIGARTQDSVMTRTSLKRWRSCGETSPTPIAKDRCEPPSSLVVRTTRSGRTSQDSFERFCAPLNVLQAAERDAPVSEFRRRAYRDAYRLPGWTRPLQHRSAPVLAG